MHNQVLENIKQVGVTYMLVDFGQSCLRLIVYTIHMCKGILRSRVLICLQNLLQLHNKYHNDISLQSFYILFRRGRSLILFYRFYTCLLFSYFQLYIFTALPLMATKAFSAWSVEQKTFFPWKGAK